MTVPPSRPHSVLPCLGRNCIYFFFSLSRQSPFIVFDLVLYLFPPVPRFFVVVYVSIFFLYFGFLYIVFYFFCYLFFLVIFFFELFSYSSSFTLCVILYSFRFIPIERHTHTHTHVHPYTRTYTLIHVPSTLSFHTHLQTNTHTHTRTRTHTLRLLPCHTLHPPFSLSHRLPLTRSGSSTILGHLLSLSLSFSASLPPSHAHYRPCLLHASRPLSSPEKLTWCRASHSRGSPRARFLVFFFSALLSQI